MKKLRKITAAVAAVIMASSMTAVTASAINVDYSTSLSSVYCYYCTETGRYYKTYDDAMDDATQNYNFVGNNVTIQNLYGSTNVDYSNTCTSVYQWYNPGTNKYYRTSSDAYSAYSQGDVYNKWQLMNSVDYSNSYSTTYHYYCQQTGRYYRSETDASNDALYNFNYTNPTISDKLRSYDFSTSYSTTYHFYCTQTGRYYKSKSDAENDALYNFNYTNATVNDMNRSYDYSTSVSSTYRYYCKQTGRYYKSISDADNDALYNFNYSNPTVYDAYNIDSSSSVSQTYPWYSSYTKKYYKTQNDALNASNNISSYVSYAYTDSSPSVSSTYPWYSSYTKRYYKTQADALNSSNNVSAYVTYAYVDSSNTVSSTYPWYSSYTKKYYKTQNDAITASNNSSVYVSYAYAETSNSVSATYPWYSSYTRKYYKTQADALAASNNISSYVSYAYVDYSSTASNTYPWYSSYTGKYYRTQTDAVQASNNNSSYVSYALNVTNGTPYITGNKAYSGWTNIASYLSRCASGSTVTIQMNGSETVGGEVLSAIDGRNITVQFVLKNGIKWIISGNDVNLSDSLYIGSASRNNVPARAIKPYKKNAVSTVKITAGYDEPLGLTAKLSVKFNKSRSGRKAYVYHYDTDSGNLEKVVTTKISSTGYCTFKTDEGGAFVIILK